MLNLSWSQSNDERFKVPRVLCEDDGFEVGNSDGDDDVTAAADDDACEKEECLL